MRIQFSIDNQDIIERLNEKSAITNVDPALICKDIVYSSFGYGNAIASIQQLEEQVYEDVRNFMKDNKGAEFTLVDVSPIFKDVPMSIGSKPSAIKAIIGKHFNAKVGQPGDFCDIEKVCTPAGKPKLSRATKAQVYRVL